MDSTSTDYISPSFSVNSFNNISNIADRVVYEFLTENGLDNDHGFSFSDEESPTNIALDVDVNNSSDKKTIEKDQEESIKEDEVEEFEFPIAFSDLNSSLVTDNDVVTSDQITYPLFDRSLLLDLDIGLNNSSIDLIETNNEPTPVLAPAPVPVSITSSEIVPATDVASTSASSSSSSTRRSLRNLFIEDRDSASTSSSDTDDLDGITPDTYCVWKPGKSPRGKHKKSNSISIGGTSKRWKVRDLLKRSYSDDTYGKDSPVAIFSPSSSPKPKVGGSDSPPVVVFLPPISPKRKMHIEKVKSMEKTSKVVATTGAATKTEHKVPAYKTKIGNIRLPPYLPYREDQLAAFANYNGSNKHMYRY